MRAVQKKRKFSSSISTSRATVSEELPELAEEDFARAIPGKQRERIIRGEISGGEDVVVLRRFVGMTQQEFADALGISVHTLRNWEQGRRSPEGPALALLRIAARHPRVLRENLAAAGWGSIATQGGRGPGAGGRGRRGRRAGPERSRPRSPRPRAGRCSRRA